MHIDDAHTEECPRCGDRLIVGDWRGPDHDFLEAGLWCRECRTGYTLHPDGHLEEPIDFLPAEGEFS